MTFYVMAALVTLACLLPMSWYFRHHTDVTLGNLRAELERIEAAPPAMCRSCPMFQAANRATEHLCVLVVDDNQAVQTSTRRMLARLGYCVECAKDGKEALAKLETYRPRVILLDLDMPGMSGVEFRMEQFARGLGDIPVALMTGSSNAHSTAIGLGVPAVLEKPFSSEQMADVLSVSHVGGKCDRVGLKMVVGKEVQG